MVAVFRPVNGRLNKSYGLHHPARFNRNWMAGVNQCSSATYKQNVSKHEIEQHSNGPEALWWLLVNSLLIWFTAAMATIRHDLAPVQKGAQRPSWECWLCGFTMKVCTKKAGLLARLVVFVGLDAFLSRCSFFLLWAYVR